MSRVLSALRRHATDDPQRLALQDGTTSFDYAQLLSQVEALAARLRAPASRGVALFADNGCAWAVADIALHVAGIPCIPLPLFFAPTQIAHAIRASGVDRILTDQPDRVDQALGLELASEPFHGNLRLITLLPPSTRPAALPDGTTKITFTSGTTGEPKGVCLGRDQIEAVADHCVTRAPRPTPTVTCACCLLPPCSRTSRGSTHPCWPARR